ncbi:hypothetical protein SK128_004289, partial [Halocaridina rubra]
VVGLSCPPCEGVSCPPVSSYNCPLGITETQCGCCHECLQGVGERCGGSFNIYGTCSDDLTCVGDYSWTVAGTCKTPEEINHGKTSTTPASITSPTTTRPWWLHG